MPLVTSGQISLNDMHVEAGGTSATQCSLNDADIRGLIGKSSGAQSQFNEFYGASSVQYIAITPASGTYTTFDSGDYRFYQFTGARNTAPLITNIGSSSSDRNQLKFKIWGAGGGGGGGGQYDGADGGAGGHTRGYYIPTATGYLRVQVASGGEGGQNMNSGLRPSGGAGGQPSSISSTNLLGGDGGDGFSQISTAETGGGGGGGGATRFRTNWSASSPSSPAFEVWIGGGGGGGGSDQAASGTPTAGGSGGATNAGGGLNYTSGLSASSIGNSGGGGGATSSAGGAGGALTSGGAAGQAGVLYHGGDGGTGPSNSFGGAGGGGAGQYGGGGGATGSSSQAAGGGGGSGNHSGSVSITASNRQSLGNRIATDTTQLGFVNGSSQGGSKGLQELSPNFSGTRAGSGGSGCVVLYHRFRN